MGLDGQHGDVVTGAPSSSRKRSSLPRVCVIGAGCSGLTTVKALLESGIPHRCFEMSDRVGGNWVFQNKNGRSGAYRSLHINTSREAMEFRDFAMPASTPDFPHHRHIARYFEDYATQFRLHDSIEFETEVVRCEKDHTRGGYRVWTRSLLAPIATGEARGGDSSLQEWHFDVVVVANGHHWDPAFPDPMPEGEFSGEVLHAHDYVDPDEPLRLRGKRVVVVGFGNSAVDIGCELGRAGVAEEVFLSTRRGAWVIPKYVLGKPLDQGSRIPRWLPERTRRWIATRAHSMLFGRMSDFGLPEPDHLLGEAHPTVSNDLLGMLGSGDIHPRGAIERFDGNRVVFAGGMSETADAVIYCTGYHVTFPFFDQAFLRAEGNQLGLFRRVFHPEYPDLAFIGLAQPLGAIMPIAEQQALWVAEYLRGDYDLPPRPKMLADIVQSDARMRRRYVASRRHTMQIDPDDYLRDLAQEREDGRQRASRHQAANPSRKSTNARETACTA